MPLNWIWYVQLGTAPEKNQRKSECGWSYSPSIPDNLWGALLRLTTSLRFVMDRCTIILGEKTLKISYF